MLREKTIKVNGRIVHYWEEGDSTSRPMLLLHGAYGDAFVQWSEAASLLAQEDYYVVALDLPGYGHSDTISPMSITHLLEWLRTVLHTLGIGQTVMIGHSFGALLGRLLAASSPELIPALVMVNGGVIPSVSPAARLLARMPLIGGMLFNRISVSNTSKAHLGSIVVTEAVLTSRFISRIEANRKALANLMRTITLSNIPEAKIPSTPVLLLWGEEDSVTPLRVAEYMQNTIPGSQLSIISNCGHLPQIEAPEVFASQVTLFLKGLDRVQRGAGAGMLSP